MNPELATIVLELEEADAAYYDGKGEIKLSDAAYDVLKERLRELDSKHPLLNTVGAPPKSSVWPKQKHEIPMGSLHKAKGASGILDWWNKTETALATA